MGADLFFRSNMWGLCQMLWSAVAPPQPSGGLSGASVPEPRRRAALRSGGEDETWGE